jgi:hypothetical protein
MIRESQKKVVEDVGDGTYREVTIKLNQHYHDNTKKLVKTEEISRTPGRLFRVAKPGEKADTQIMCAKTFSVLSLVQVEEKTAATPAPAAEKPAKPEKKAEAPAPKKAKEKPAPKTKPEESGTTAEALAPEPAKVDTPSEEESTDEGTNEDDMSTKKAKAKKTTAKKAAPKKAAAKKAAAPKEPKAKKAKAAAKKSVPPKAAKDAPTTGQSGPPVDFSKKSLNPKEAKVLGALNHGSGPRSIAEIAEIWKSQGLAKANSHVRNSLRRLVRGGLVEQVERGVYKLTAKGKKHEASAS